MADAFILGSGFSRAVSPAMPTLRDLSSSAVPYLRDIAPEALHNDKIPFDDLEVWLSSLTERWPYLEEHERLKSASLFVQVAKWLADTLAAAQDTAINEVSRAPSWLLRLVRAWHPRRTPVITLNYDLLVEAAIDDGALPDNPRYHHAYAAPLPLPPRLAQGAFPDSYKSTFSLIKLHGSLNWYYSGARDFYGETIYDVGLPLTWERPPERRLTLARLAKETPGKVPLIIPPTGSKTRYFNNEILEALWRHARAALKAADHIYCIGYSLPVTDLMVRGLLESTCAAKTIVPVNTDPNITAHYQELLPDVSVSDAWVGRPDVVEGFTKTYR